MTNTTRTFSELRLRLADEILRNNQHIVGASNDIDSVAEIEELCDTYAMRQLICWIATRRGCNKYLQAISSDRHTEAPPAQTEFSDVESFFLSGQIYPFNSDVVIAGKQELERLTSELLDGCLEPTFELIGSLHEHMSSYDLGLARDGTVDIRCDMHSKSKRKSKGQFYTPSWTVGYCLQKSLASDLNDFMKRLTASSDLYIRERSKKKSEQSSPKVLDPSCGTGNFLLGVIDLLKGKNVSPLALVFAASNCLFGFDTDGKAVCLARLSIFLSILEDICKANSQLDSHELGSRKNSPTSGSPLDPHEILRSIASNIKVTDSIYEPISAEHAAGAGFDLVITNPPYLSFGARNQEKIADETLAWLKSQFPISSEYKIRYNAIFQELALKHVRDGGKVCLLVPDGFLTGKRYSRLRDGLLKQTKIVSLTEFPDDTIGGAVVGRWCAAIYEKCNSNIESPSETFRGTDDYKVELESFVETDKDPETPKSRQSLTYRLPVSSLVTRDLKRFRLVFNKLDEELLTRCDQLTPLHKVLRGHTGIRARNGQKTILAQTREGSTFRRGIRSGASVRPYSVTWDGTWIRVESQLLFAGGFDSGIVESPKILMRQTGDRIIAAYDDSCLYHLNNVHSFSTARLKSALQADSGSFTNDLMLLTGLMNSKLWAYLYRLRTREDGRALAQIDIETVEQMPLPENSTRQSQELVGAISALSKILSTNVEGEDASRIKRCIDRLAYEVYELSSAEVARVESKIATRQEESFNCALPELDEALGAALRYS